MLDEIVLEDHSDRDRRDRAFEAIDELDVGDTVTIAGIDAEVVLGKYQVDRGYTLERKNDRSAGDAVTVTKERKLAADEYSKFDVRSMPPQKRNRVLPELTLL